MANENKKNNELVSDDDDPTAELEVSELRATVLHDASASDAYVDDDDTSSVRTQTYPEPQDDADESSETIGRLQHDMEQLRTKWLGFETEISAREEVVSSLQKEVDELKSDVANRRKLLKKRDKKIKSFKSEISDLNRNHAQLAEEHAATLRQFNEQTEAAAKQSDELADAVRELEGARSELQSELEIVANLESNLKARDAAQSSLEKQHEALTEELADLQAIDAEHVLALDKAEVELQERRGDLETASEEITGLLTKIAEKDQANVLLDEQHAELRQQIEEQRSTIAERDAAVAAAEHELKEARLELKQLLDKGPPEVVLTNISRSDVQEIQAQIARTEKYADTLRNNLSDLTESYDGVAFERDELSRSLERMTSQNTELSEEIANANASIADLQAAIEKQQTEHQAAIEKQQAEQQAALDQSQAAIEKQQTEHQAAIEKQQAEHQAAIEKQQAEQQAALDQSQAAIEKQQTEQQALLDELQADHEQEIRDLRFELGEAQDTVTETAGMNEQLAAELLQAREFKEDLENALNQNDERAKDRISELEKQISQLTRTTEEFEHKLDTRSTAIHTLLGELAKKSERIDSISEIEQVVREIDDRMSSRLDSESVPGDPSAKSHVVLVGDDAERVSRLMIGKIGDHVLRFPLFKDRVTIGRTDENDICLKTAYVSRQHAVVITEGDRARVIDAGSRNGVFVNSKRVKEHSLSNGDIVTVGDTSFRYVERRERQT